MKHLILIAALAIATVQANLNKAEAKFHSFKLTSYELKPAQLDPESRLLKGEIEDASLIVNETANVVTLVVNPKFTCPEGMMCAMVMPAPIIIELPIKHISIPFCGGRIIFAEENLMPVDGPRTAITLFEEGYNVCTKELSDRVTVTLEEEALYMSGERYQATSVFEGFKVIPRHILKSEKLSRIETILQ